MSNLIELFQIRSALKQLPDNIKVKASSDPTMLFSGVVWGKNIFIDKKLFLALWPLKTALFQHGDNIIEAVIEAVGLDAFEKHFLANESADDFYLFDPAHIEAANKKERFEGMKNGYQECKIALKTHLPEHHKVILKQWIDATNKAIRSVFHLREWQMLLKEADSQKLWELARTEEESKNVVVVSTLVNAAKELGHKFSYPGESIDLIRASSRWFTLIDDYLDLEEDHKLKQPNYLIALLIKNKEWEVWQKAVITSPDAFSAECPLTIKEYKKCLDKARTAFKKAFPVLPSLFTWWIEKEARKKGKSPF